MGRTHSPTVKIWSMKIFHCDHCQQLVFFENIQCLSCYRPLAYLPDLGVVGSLDPAAGGIWRSPIPRAIEHAYRLCENYDRENICNWVSREVVAETLIFRMIDES